VALELSHRDEKRCKKCDKCKNNKLCYCWQCHNGGGTANSINTRSGSNYCRRGEYSPRDLLATSGEADGSTVVTSWRFEHKLRGLVTFRIAAVGEQQLNRHQSEQIPVYLWPPNRIRIIKKCKPICAMGDNAQEPELVPVVSDT
jgi:hypothetical protein